MLRRLVEDPRRVFPPLIFLFGSAVASLTYAIPVSAQGLTYAVSPSARWIDWDEDLGFDQSRLLGGSVGIGFGRYVGLQVFHHQEDGLELFKSTEGNGTPQLFDLAQSGVQVSVALGSGTIIPILVGGGSLFHFEPQEREALKKLTLEYGAGIRTVLGESLYGEVLLESNQYRLDPAALSTGEPSFEGIGPLRRNMTLRASVGLQLGRRSFDRASELDDAFVQQYQAPFSNFALAVEPLLGRLDYDKAVGLEDQEMVGIRGGFDFGSFFGLRGFHWWGTESDFRSTTDLKAWGGEAQFTLSGGPGMNPYLTAGAGQLSWGEAEEGEPALPEDQTALIVGGGVEFNFGPHVRATVAARDFILAGSDLSISPDLNTISDPDELVHNWQFSAGLKFLVGRSGIRSGSRAAQPEADTPGQPVEEVAAVERKAPGQPEAAPTFPEAKPVPAPRAVPDTVLVVDTIIRADTTTLADTVVRDTAPQNTIVLPVLEQGEIYIRFGEPGAVPVVSAVRARGEGAPEAPEAGEAAEITVEDITLEDIRRLIQEELAEQPQELPATDPESLRALEARLQQRLDEIEAAARRAETAAARRGQAPVVVSPEPETVVVPRGAGVSGGPGRRVEELRPHTGLDITRDVQLALGLAADIGPLNPGSTLNLVPQLALGFGEGPNSFLVSTDVEYRLPEVDAGSRVTFEPLISAGPGLIKRDDWELQLGMFLGSGIRLYKENGTPGLHLFGGLQGIDFFDDTRIILGLRRMR